MPCVPAFALTSKGYSPKTVSFLAQSFQLGDRFKVLRAPGRTFDLDQTIKGDASAIDSKGCDQDSVGD